jgi:polyisoprenoid-binding protein YceI
MTHATGNNISRNAVAGSTVGEKLRGGALIGAWVLDRERTSVRLATKAMWGRVPVRGTFREVRGTAQVTGPDTVSARLEIESASINTKMKMRDHHLRSEDFFAAEAHPTITVEIEKVEPTGPGLQAAGTLTIRGRSIPLSFPVTVTELADDSVVLDAVVGIDRSEIGLDYRARGATHMHNDLTVHAVFTRA